MEFEGRGEAGGKVLPVMAAGIEMKFMGNFARGENFIENGCAALETVVVLRATVKIDF